MQELHPSLYHHIHGGGDLKTTTYSDSPNWKCECFCHDSAQRKLLDENDDSWAWWFFTRPYYIVKGVITSFL